MPIRYIPKPPKDPEATPILVTIFDDPTGYVGRTQGDYFQIASHELLLAREGSPLRPMSVAPTQHALAATQP